ncbi:helix-turn-helix domain-containing protein [Methylobacterium sp. J-026]|uniref:helix-turn-helix domain-containing protein n=1 Tax=Methylobacterium sp. J-026 TaxID=2836624 RepID=UPI001FBAA1E2|nr:helix-turn-helix transcriptional regulator [Methylobacterium sp. J-026]MCJ2137326.1 helix-turn-helix domain-containing protein [Methylobacterium sp. J-026]
MVQLDGWSWPLELGDEPPAERDRPLTFHWRPRTGETLNSSVFTSMQGTDREISRQHIIAEAMLAHEEGRYVSYSRRKAFYTGRRRYHGTAFTYTNVLSCVEELLRQGLIEEERASPGNLGWQSRFRASTKLAEACSDVEFHHKLIGLIFLKDADGNLVDYQDTDATIRMTRELRAINADLASLRVELPGPDVVRSRHHIVVDGAYYRPTKGALYRIFNRRSFALGGRAFGWWQNLPSRWRRRLVIDGEPVVEPDFAQLHPSLLYALCGCRLDGDAYETGEFSREHGKLAFNVALNTKTPQGTIAALANKPRWTLSRAQTADLLAALARRNAPIAGYLHADRGIALMNIDSRITVRAVRRCIAVGIPVLPVHDSMLTPRRYESRVAEIMEESAEFVLKRPKPCRVNVSSPTVPHMPGGGCLSPPFLPRQLVLFRDLPSPRDFGGQIRLLRRTFGFSQASLAAKLGCRQPHVANVESGRHRLGEWARLRLRDLFRDAEARRE